MIPVNILDSIRLKDIKLSKKVTILDSAAGIVKWTPIVTYTNPSTTARTVVDLSYLNMNKVKEIYIEPSFTLTNNLTSAANQNFTLTFTLNSTTVTNVITAPSAYTSAFSSRSNIRTTFVSTDGTNDTYNVYLSTLLYQVASNGALTGFTKTADQVVTITLPVGSTLTPTLTMTAQTGTTNTVISVDSVKTTLIKR